MRGVIEVVDDAGQIPPAAPTGDCRVGGRRVDLDAAHGADHAQPAPQEALSPLVDAAALATLAVPEPLRSPGGGAPTRLPKCHRAGSCQFRPAQE